MIQPCVVMFLTDISVIMGINRDLHSISCKIGKRSESKVTGDGGVMIQPGEIYWFGLNNIQ